MLMVYQCWYCCTLFALFFNEIILTLILSQVAMENDYLLVKLDNTGFERLDMRWIMFD